MINTNSIAFLICWYEDYPWYFPYFLHSCRYNPTIDFFIFTDNKVKLELPPNVKIIPYSLEQFKADASKELGFEAAIEYGYKHAISSLHTDLFFG